MADVPDPVLLKARHLALLSAQKLIAAEDTDPVGAAYWTGYAAAMFDVVYKIPLREEGEG